MVFVRRTWHGGVSPLQGQVPPLRGRWRVWRFVSALPGNSSGHRDKLPARYNCEPGKKLMCSASDPLGVLEMAGKRDARRR
jgi:hypothetical protein